MAFGTALAGPASALPRPIQPPAIDGAAIPSISGLSASVAPDAPSGTAVARPTATLPGCSWSIAGQGYFAQAAATGAVTKAAASVPAGSYAPLVSCTRSAGGQTVTVSASLSIGVAGTGTFAASLDHSDARNSFYF